jgi:hypothetical protein
MDDENGADADRMFELIEAFDDLLARLNGDWRLHRELFQDPANYDLFSQSSPLVWQILGDALVDSVLLSIARLLDPPKTLGKTNLSIAQVLSQLEPGPALEKLVSEYKKLRTNSDAALRHWRNRRLTHNDLATLTRVAPLPKITYDEISALVHGLSEIGRTVGHVAQGVDKNFVPYVSNSDWIWRLTKTLKCGIHNQALPVQTKKDIVSLEN